MNIFFKQMIHWSLFAGCLWVGHSSAKSLVVIRDYVRVPRLGPVFLLDVIDGSAKEDLSEEYKNVKIGVFDQFGDEIQLTEHALTLILKSLKKDFRPQGELITFKIPKMIRVKAVPPILSEKEVKNQLNYEWSKLCLDCRFEILNMELPVHSENFSWRIGAVSRVSTGSFIQPLILESFDRAKAETRWIKGDIVISKKLPVAKKDLLKGQRITEEDVDWTWQKVSSMIVKGVESSQLEHSQIARFVSQGSVLTSQDLTRELLVKKGASVSSILKSLGWQISVPLIAEENGYLGDHIQLRNAKTQSSVSGVVIRRGEVEIQ